MKHMKFQKHKCIIKKKVSNLQRKVQKGVHHLLEYMLNGRWTVIKMRWDEPWKMTMHNTWVHIAQWNSRDWWRQHVDILLVFPPAHQHWAPASVVQGALLQVSLRQLLRQPDPVFSHCATHHGSSIGQIMTDFGTTIIVINVQVVTLV